MSHETLTSPSSILLYGRVMEDLEYVYHPSPDNRAEPDRPLPRYSANRFLEEQLAVKNHKGEPGFARIYGFSFEGHYYDLHRPMIYLVHGPGADPEGPPPGEGYDQQRYSRHPTNADLTGVAARSAAFSSDMKVWAYDKADFSLRLDVDSGPFEEILLLDELGGVDGLDYSRGINARGINARGINARGINARGINARSKNKDD